MWHVYDMVWHLMKGIEVTDETIALDVVDAVGPAGNDLAQKHTQKNRRNLWVPKYMDRRTYMEWEAKQDGAADWVTDEARGILENHKPEKLDTVLADELQNIIRAIEVG